MTDRVQVTLPRDWFEEAGGHLNERSDYWRTVQEVVKPDKVQTWDYDLAGAVLVGCVVATPQWVDREKEGWPTYRVRVQRLSELAEMLRRVNGLYPDGRVEPQTE